MSFTPRGTSIMTVNGEYVDPLAVSPRDISFPAIAHSLSLICRWTGHCSEFWSVGQHSLSVSFMLEAIGANRALQLWGLLHDSGEAYMGDMSRPLKLAPEMSFYKDAEQNILEAVADRLKLHFPYDARVKQADDWALDEEAFRLMPDIPGWVSPDTPEEARASFHATYETLIDSPPRAVRHHFMDRLAALTGGSF